MRNVVRNIVSLFVVVAMAFGTMPAYAADATTVAEECAKVAPLINDYRAQHGLAQLKWSDEMTAATNLRACEISQVYDHVRPDGTKWYTANPDLFYGEIIGDGFTHAENIVSAWINSPSHLEQIVRPELEYINVSIHVDENNHWWWACELG